MSAATVRPRKPPSAPKRPAKPPAPKISLIPDELKARPQWVAWKYELRGEKWTKIPYQPRRPGSKAKADVPETWSSFDVAWAVYQAGGFDGIGYEFSADDPYFGVDVDDCLRDAGVMGWALPHVDAMAASYGEISPSGKGLKFVARGKLPEPMGTRREGLGPNGTGALELYDHGRFFTITGDVFGGSNSIADLPQAAVSLYRVAKPIGNPGKKPQSGGNGHVPRSGSPGFTASDQDVFDAIGRSRTAPKIRALWSGHWQGMYGSQSQADEGLCNYLAFFCGKGNEAQVERLFLQSKLGQRVKATSRPKYVADTVDFAYLGRTDFYAWSNQPKILITTQEKEVNDQAVAALASDPDLYRLGYLLATILHEGEAPRGVNYPDGPPPQIATIEPATLRERMAAVAKWFAIKVKGEQASQVPAHPPDWSVQAVHKRGVWPGIRPVVGIIEAPTMRPDGSILSTPGYDPATRLFYRPNTTFEPIPESPKQWDAKQAKDELLDLVSEFPFKDENHKAVWLAALLTVIGRASFEGEIPLFAFDGNCPGAGKSKLADLISLIASGRRMPRMVWPSGNQADEEIRKRITSLALAGTRFTLLDNVDVPIGGAPLDAALTGDCWEDRLLCTNKSSGVLPLVMTWFATGNNIQYRGDFIRRALPCRIESKDENPEERTGFKYPDLNGHVKANRGRFVRDALVILRAFRLLRNPGILPALGSFEVWTHAVADPVMWITGNNPFDVRPSIKASDHNGQMRTAMVIGWAELPGADSGLTVATALAILNQQQSALLYDTLRSALLEMSDKSGQLPSAKSIGRHLQAMEGRNV
ncbi:MAG: hypothetical protein ACLQU5_25030 [Isosphaeraceae bacterium]